MRLAPNVPLRGGDVSGGCSPMHTVSLVRPRSFLAAFVALSVVLGAASTIAEAGTDVSSLREFDVGDGKVTFDVSDAPFGQLVREKIQPRTRVNVIVSPLA